MRDTAEGTLQQFAKYLDERSGIFASLRDYELPWDSPIHVCTGRLKPHFCLAEHRPRPAISESVSGSGISAFEARASCLCEALERHSGIFRVDEPRRVARYAEIAGEAVHPEALTLFSESQYDERESWNQREGLYNWVPERFDAERRIDWTPAWSLTQKRTEYLPTAYCYFGYPFDPAHDFCRPDSNGNAAGNSLDGAIVHGFLELVERECASVWWYNRVRRPRVNLAGFSSPSAMAVRNLFGLLGRSVEVLDITVDARVPTFVAISRSVDPPCDDFTFGFGAHFVAQVAVTRALTEMAQSVPAIISEHDPVCFLSAEGGPMDTSFLTPDQAMDPTARSGFSPLGLRSETQEKSWCGELAQSWGLEMLVLDQTREDVGMPVVKVVVPGMRSWWARFAAGRLYTLPVQAGWLAKPRTEADLNPCHLVL